MKPIISISLILVFATQVVAQKPSLFMAAPKGGFSTNQDSTTHLVLRDFDGDGDLDLVTGNAETSRSGRYWVNDGHGKLTMSSTALVIPPNYTLAMASDDFDGDGDHDLVIFGLQKRYLFLNQGKGTFVDATNGRLPSASVNPSCIACGDIDGDGDKDLVVGTYYYNFLYLNNGKAVFTKGSGRIPPLHCRTHALALGDIDGDGDLDLVTGNAKVGAPQQNRVYLNDGKGYFKDATYLLPNQSGQTYAILLADLDGDHDLDLIHGNQTYPGGAADILYLNNGSGAFKAMPKLIPDRKERTRALAAGDLDGDGDLDIVVGVDVPGSPNRVYLNDGKATFTDLPIPAWLNMAHDTRVLALGDMDGDGDLDIIAGNTAKRPDRLHINLTRQVYAPAIAALNSPYNIDFYTYNSQGTSMSLVLPFLARETGNIPIKPFGTFMLSTSGLMPMPLLLISPQVGKGVIQLTIPGNTALLGQGFYTQGLVIPSLLFPPGACRFTNLDGGEIGK